MPRQTKLDRLRTERATALATLKAAQEAHRAAIAALPETAALVAAAAAQEAASIAYIREHERVQRRADVRTEYEVREINSDGDAFNCWAFPTKGEAMGCARAMVKRLYDGHAVAVERVRDGAYVTVWTGGSSEAIAAWNGEFDDDYGDN
jgi:hypothetical protein